MMMKKMQNYLIKHTTQGKNNFVLIDTPYVVPIMCVDDNVDGRPR
jgi:hypothetical protein